MNHAVVSAKIGGEFACFTRPEFKVERVSYPVMTPSAARGVLEAIFWKPEIQWQVRSIALLKPIRQLTVLRNEVSKKMGGVPILVEDDRQQRAGLILKDVAYVIHADLIQQAGVSGSITKYTEQFRRRLQRGQCHHTPCLGTREFAAWFEPVTAADEPLPLDLDLGRLFFDRAFVPDSTHSELTFVRHEPSRRRIAGGFTTELFFNASIEQGIIQIPAALYEQRNRLEGRDVA